MAMYKYYAVVTKDLEDGCYLVNFPDLENVFTDAETLPEAVKNAEEVLEGMLEVMLEHGDEFNPPTQDGSEFILPRGASLISVQVEVNIPEGAL